MFVEHYCQRMESVTTARTAKVTVVTNVSCSLCNFGIDLYQ